MKKSEKNIYRCHKSFGLLVNVESDHDAIIKYKGQTPITATTTTNNNEGKKCMPLG